MSTDAPGREPTQAVTPGADPTQPAGDAQGAAPLVDPKVAAGLDAPGRDPLSDEADD